MPEEGFLRRWARRKTESRLGVAPAEEAPSMPAPVARPAAGQEAAPAAPVGLAVGHDAGDGRAPPTMDDVARLTGESDFSAFVAHGVDQAVRRSALKKLFADPHFHAMDGLDVYIADFTRPSPVSEEMLASLQHAKKLFRREPPEDAPPAAADAATPAPATAGQDLAAEESQEDAVGEQGAASAESAESEADGADRPAPFPVPVQDRPAPMTTTT